MLLCKLESQCEGHGMRLLELKRCIQPVADGVRVLTPIMRGPVADGVRVLTPIMRGPVADGVRVLTPIVRGVEDEGWGSTEVLDMLHAAVGREGYAARVVYREWYTESGIQRVVYREWYTESGIQRVVYREWYTESGIQRVVYREWYTVSGIQRVVSKEFPSFSPSSFSPPRSLPPRSLPPRYLLFQSIHPFPPIPHLTPVRLPSLPPASLPAQSTRPDVREAEGLIRFVLQATCAPYLHLLSSYVWMQEGRLEDDIHSEFFISACTTASADAHTATTDAEPTNSTAPATRQGEWRGAQGWEWAKVEGQRFVLRCDAVPVLFRSVADDVLATGQLVHALRQHGYLKQCNEIDPFPHPRSEQPSGASAHRQTSAAAFPGEPCSSHHMPSFLGAASSSVSSFPSPHPPFLNPRDLADFLSDFMALAGEELCTALYPCLSCAHPRHRLRQVLLQNPPPHQADFLSDFMALAGEELCKPASRASQARIDLSLGASLHASDPNCDRLSARLVPADPPSPSNSSLQQQPLHSQPLQSQSPLLQRTPAQPPQSHLQQSRESMDGADLLSSLQSYDQYEDLLGPDADDAGGDSHAAYAAAAAAGAAAGGRGADGDNGGDGGGKQLYSNPLSLLPQVTPVRPGSPAAAVAAQAARGGGAERRGASGESGWEAICIDYQAPWPVSAVVPPAALQGYNRLFRFLLATRRTHLHLALAWSALQLTRGLKVEGTMLQRVHWLRHRMACAVTAILDHVAHAVISPNFDLMTSSLTKATSFHQLVEEHQTFLHTCLSEGLLDSCQHIRE
ncbi:unnamed protein product, partial [Closterium sp. NIES-65]